MEVTVSAPDIAGYADWTTLSQRTDLLWRACHPDAGPVVVRLSSRGRVEPHVLEHLAGRGAPVLLDSGRLPEPGILGRTHWLAYPYIEGATSPPTQHADLIASAHALLHGLHPVLFGGWAPQTKAQVRVIRSVLSEKEKREVLGAISDRWRAARRAGSELGWGPVHGDASRSNTLTSVTGEAVLIDWGSVTWAPREWDWATLLLERDNGVSDGELFALIQDRTSVSRAALDAWAAMKRAMRATWHLERGDENEWRRLRPDRS